MWVEHLFKFLLITSVCWALVLAALVWVVQFSVFDMRMITGPPVLVILQSEKPATYSVQK